MLCGAAVKRKTRGAVGGVTWTVVLAVTSPNFVRTVKV